MQVRVLLFLASMVATASPALAKARADNMSFIPVGSQMKAPRGYDEMCSSHPEWCRSNVSAVVLHKAPMPALPQETIAVTFDVRLILASVTHVGKTIDMPPEAKIFDLNVDRYLATLPAFDATRWPMQAVVRKSGDDFASSSAYGLPGINITLNVPAIAPFPPLAEGRATNLISIGMAASAATDASAIAATGGIELSVRSTRTKARRKDVTPEMALLQTVNRKVNGRVVQRRDSSIFGQGELWRRSGIGRNATGDCEDLAIEKRLQLVAEGFPPEKLAYAVVYDRRLGLHTVLIARTKRGDMVLDSATPYISNWGRTGYSWISIQAMDDPARWFSVARSRAV